MSVADFRNTPLAVVGMGCRLPGADGLEQFWQLLIEGRHGIAELPPERLDQRLYYDARRQTPEKSYSRIAGTVPLRPLNRSYCPIPDASLPACDETHLAMCEVACAAVQQAGYGPGQRALPRTGVFIGNCTGSNLEAELIYNSHAAELSELLQLAGARCAVDQQVLQSAAAGFCQDIRSRTPSWNSSPVRGLTPYAAARLIQETLQLSGPACALDAACASSFYGIHLAAMALHRGRIDAAIVGAFSYRNWWEMVLLSPTQTMSASHSSPFSDDSDGMVPSDGYAAVVLKPLPQAQRDGDHILGVIRSMGISSDGRGKAVWAPRQEGQVMAIRRAYAGGLDPRRLQYIEAHATSTQLGDATEVASLQEALGAYVPPHIPVGSVKANVGHTLEVAGMAGLLKTLLAMQHGVIPPAIVNRPLNSQIDWQHLPFRVNDQPLPWPAPANNSCRRAAVDAFGIGGLNIHMVVDQTATVPPQTEQAPEDLLAATEAVPATAPSAVLEALAIVGIGQPLQQTALVHEFLQLCRLPAATATAPGGEADAPTEYEFNWKKHRIPPRQLEVANPLQFLLLDAAASALEDGQQPQRGFSRARVGTVVGTPFTSDFYCDAVLGARLPEIRESMVRQLQSRGVAESDIARITETFKAELLARKPASLDVTGSLSSSTLSSMVAKQLDLLGGAVTVEAGPHTPHAALLAAIDLLQSHTCDTVVCAVGQRITDTSFQQMQQAGKRLPSADLGTGAAAIVLKRLSDAQRDQDPIRGILPPEAAEQLSQALQAAVSPTVRTDTAGPAAAGSAADQTPAVPSATRGAAPPTGPARSATVRRRPGRDQLQTALLDAVQQLTGLPPQLVQLTAHLSDDLGLNSSVRQLLVRSIQQEFPGLAQLTTPTESSCTLQQLLDRLLADLPQPTSHRSPAAEAQGLAAAARPAVSPHSDQPSADQPCDVRHPLTRCVLRCIETPLPADAAASPVFHGCALIVGDNPAVAALQERLQSLQVPVLTLATTQPGHAVLQQLESQLQTQTIPHLFLLADRDSAAALQPDAVGTESAAARASTTMQICQRWYQHVQSAGLLSQASLAAAVSLSGDFGISGRLDAVSGAGTAALLRALSAETQGQLRVRVIDAPANEPPRMIAAALCRELAADTPDPETASVRGKRYVVRATACPGRPAPATAVTARGVWLVAGLECPHAARAVRQLAQQFKLRLHILSEQPQSAVHSEASLTDLRQAGIAATWHTRPADRPDTVREIVDNIRRTDGPLQGVLFAGAVPAAVQFLKLDAESLEGLLRQSLSQAALLLELTASEPGLQFVSLTSAAGRIPAALRTGEAVASALLQAAVSRFSEHHTAGPPTAATRRFSLLYPAQAVLPGNGSGSPAAANAAGFTPAQTAAAVHQELLMDSQESTVLYLQRQQLEQPQYSILPTAAAADRSAIRQPLVLDAPLIHHVFPGFGTQGVAELQFDPVRDPFLNGHLNDGVPLLPAVMGIESCAQAASIWSGGRQVLRLRNQQILNGFRMAQPQLHHARVQLAGSATEISCQLLGEFYDKQGVLTDPWRLYQTCVIDLADHRQELPAPEPGHVPTSWTEVPYPDDWRQMGAAESGTVYYGPELRTLKFVQHDPEGSWGRMLAPDIAALGGARRGAHWHTPAALLDGALFLCDLYAAHTLGTRQLPHVIDQIDFGRLPRAGEECLARVIFRGQSGRRLTWDFWILGSDGTVILWTQGFHVVTL